MRRLVTLLIVVALVATASSQGQYPNCDDSSLSCRGGTSPISPLSYTTMRSDGYFGTQPSNDGCTPIDGQGTINCGVETTLIDCENGNQSNINYTDLSSYFVWNKTINQQVYIVFRFDQQVNISRISLYFWSQPYFGVDITIPDLTLYWSNDDPTTPSNNVSFDLNPTITRFGNERQRRRRNIDIIDQDLLLQFLRIVMTITEGTHVFLSEVLFCGSINTITSTTATTSAAIVSTTSLTTDITAIPYTTSTFLSTTTTPVSSGNDGSSGSNIGLIVIVIVLAIIIIVLIIIGVVVIIVLWKRNKSESTKPEGVYYSTIDGGTLQTSLPSKPEPVYTEISDEQNNTKNISNTSPTQQHVTIQDNPAYSDPKEQVALQDNPASSDVVNEQIKLQDNPAYGITSI